MNIPFAAKVTLGRRDRDHQRDRRRRRLHRQRRHQATPTPASTGRPAPATSRASRPCSSCARATASANGSDLGAHQQPAAVHVAPGAQARERRGADRTRRRCYKLATTAVDNITPSKSLTNPLTLVQIALAVKNVPFDEIVFVQYPVARGPVRPEPRRAELRRRRRSCGPRSPRTSRSSSPATRTLERRRHHGRPDPDRPGDTRSDARRRPAPPTAPTETAIELPDSITGSTAAQETCSTGNLRG